MEGLWVKPIVEVGLGLNRIGHMSVQPEQDWTPKFAGHVLPDQTSTGPILFSKFLHMYYVWVINSNRKRTLITDLDSKTTGIGHDV